MQKQSEMIEVGAWDKKVLRGHRRPGTRNADAAQASRTHMAGWRQALPQRRWPNHHPRPRALFLGCLFACTGASRGTAERRE
jgi:hypothetical protein